MHENGWFSVRRSAKTLYLQEQKRKENILKRAFQVDRPNEVWGSDVTYFSVKNKNYYICVIIDLFARKVLACNISLKNTTQFTKATLKAAYLKRFPTGPLLLHTDQGCNCTSKGFMTLPNLSESHNPFHARDYPMIIQLWNPFLPI
jgi:transposase InsO family protein